MRQVFGKDDDQARCLNSLFRKRDEMIEARTFREAPDRLVITFQVFAALLNQLSRPRLDCPPGFRSSPGM